MFSMLVVDDDDMTRQSLARIFSGEGAAVTALDEGDKVAAELETRRFDIGLIDIHLPGMDGIEILKLIRERDPDCAVVMMTAFASLDTAISALRLGAADYLIKPFDMDQVRLVVSRILERRRLLEDNLEFSRDVISKYDFSRIITGNPEFQAVLESLKRVTKTDSTILIRGESGTGKELVARAVHNNSDRAHRPMIAVNCAAIPATLLESELFGYVKGAFTGAWSDRKGYFERANGSTLFLDEIGELSLDLQVKLLRVLQEKQINRVGESKTMDIDFRLVAATQRDLAQEAKQGRFREDLFYRLNVFPVNLPPLRERPEDIGPLADNYLGRVGKRQIKISDEALEHLRRYAWPGNVRELENVIERAVLLADGDTIESSHLAPEIRGRERKKKGVTAIRVEIPAGANDYGDVVRQAGELARRELIVRALAESKGNVTHTARALKMSRRHLTLKMLELGLRTQKR